LAKVFFDATGLKFEIPHDYKSKQKFNRSFTDSEANIQLLINQKFKHTNFPFLFRMLLLQRNPSPENLSSSYYDKEIHTNLLNIFREKITAINKVIYGEPLSLDVKKISSSTNPLIELNDFKYRSSYDDLTTIPVVGPNAGQFESVALNTGNLIHDKTLSLQWNLDNLAPVLKTWTNDELTYRLNFGTGNFDGSGANSETFINTDYYSPSSLSAEFSAFTGFTDENLRSYLRDDVISGFWIAIDAREKDGGVKYTSQQTLAGTPYNQPHGYLFGLFQNDQMTSEKYDINTATALINSDNNISVVVRNPESYFGSIYIFFTDQSAATGYLTQDNLNSIMYQQFTGPSYTSFVKALANSGIQLREAFFNGADTFTTTTSFVKSVGAGLLKSGYMTLRPSTQFEDNLMAQYEKDFDNGSTYDLGNYQRNVFYARCQGGTI
jgi:hypothetical protein